MRWPWPHRRGRPITVVLVLLLLGISAFALRSDWERVIVPDRPAPVTGRPHLSLGVTTVALARNAAVEWDAGMLRREVRSFEQAAGRRVEIVAWFGDFAGPTFKPSQAAAVERLGAIPEVTWEPWDASNTATDQPQYRLATIIDGEHDATITRWARAIAFYGQPLRLRFGHEMNGRWYPWAEQANGNRAGEFVRAWRHVRRIFREQGATNVRWIWAPVAGALQAEQFPGADEVDVLGISGFNGGTELYRRRWRSFETAFGPTLDALHALAPQLPVAISEVASTERGGSKARWIEGMFASLRTRPWIRSLVWFELRKETDWRIVSSEAARLAFARGAAAAVRPPSAVAGDE